MYGFKDVINPYLALNLVGVVAVGVELYHQLVKGLYSVKRGVAGVRDI